MAEAITLLAPLAVSKFSKLSAAEDVAVAVEKNLPTFEKELQKILGDGGLNEAGGRLFRSINDFKSAISRGDNVFYVGKHTDITPRPTGINGIAESHHGVNSVWMKEKYADYGTGSNAPSVYMLKEPNHNATRGEFNRWAAEIRAKQGTSQIDYSKVTKDEITILANRQFDVADVPQIVRKEYFLLWDNYVKTLTIK